MTRISRLCMPLAAAALLGSSLGASALEPLGQNTYVTERLVAARVADRIRKNCPSISGRMIYAFRQALALKSWAEDQGYSDEDIDRFLDDKAEKKKIYARADDYLSANGAVRGAAAGYCALGKKEIAAKTLAGSLIYEKK